VKLHWDYETRGVLDLNQVGVYAYGEHPETKALLVAWAIDDDKFRWWNILRGDPMPLMLRIALLDPTVTIVAHNANFEFVVSMIVGSRQGFLDEQVIAAIRDLGRWSCTAARAAACGLPRALEKVCNALHVEHKKDMAGHKLMMEMCKPIGLHPSSTPENPVWMWFEDAPRVMRLGAYACADGYAERDVDDALPDLTPSEQEVWVVNERMNSRGVEVDTVLLNKLMLAVTDAVIYLNAKINRLTNGQVEKVSQPQRIVAWLKNYGIDTEDDKIGRWIIEGLLEDATIPDIVREVLVTRRDGGKSSTAKFNTLLRRMNTDGRIRGALLYCGAAATGRFSSKGVQLQNLPRSRVVKQVSKAIEAVLTNVPLVDIESSFGPPMVVFSELVRPMFIAPKDYWLARGDYSQIEARVNPWLAAQQDEVDAFRAFDRGEGPDIYIVTAAKMHRVDPSEIGKNDPRRQSGKTTSLACGFGGGMGALLKMAKIYNMKLSDEEAESSKEAWRDVHPDIKQFWYDLENTAMKCMRNQPGITWPVGKTQLISFRRNSQNLAMRLPSGRQIIYWYAKIEDIDTPWGEVKPGITYYSEHSQKHIWHRKKAWHGIFCENSVQAIARDIMAYALVRMERLGMTPVLTVHDEGICQVPKSRYPTARAAAQAVLDVMLDKPAWAVGLPVAAEASADERYTKGSDENTVTGYSREDL
jgi:DNA polymerase